MALESYFAKTRIAWRILPSLTSGFETDSAALGFFVFYKKKECWRTCSDSLHFIVSMAAHCPGGPVWPADASHMRQTVTWRRLLRSCNSWAFILCMWLQSCTSASHKNVSAQSCSLLYLHLPNHICKNFKWGWQISVIRAKVDGDNCIQKHT